MARPSQLWLLALALCSQLCFEEVNAKGGRYSGARSSGARSSTASAGSSTSAGRLGGSTYRNTATGSSRYSFSGGEFVLSRHSLQLQGGSYSGGREGAPWHPRGRVAAGGRRGAVAARASGAGAEGAEHACCCRCLLFGERASHTDWGRDSDGLQELPLQLTQLAVLQPVSDARSTREGSAVPWSICLQVS